MIRFAMLALLMHTLIMSAASSLALIMSATSSLALATS
jgi:hypothetical protein